MMRSLYSGVSGLKTHQTKMDVIGNNIANVNTIAFKSSATTFTDIMYQTTSGASGATQTTGGKNANQIGLGVTSGSTKVSITAAGAAQSTGQAFDIKLTDSNNTNFFIVNNGSQNLFTRSGSFYVDGVGNLCMTSTGYTVQGWQVDPLTGDIKKDTVSPLRIMQAANITSSPEATTNATVSGVIDKNDTNVSSDTGYYMSLSLYDNLGYQYTAKFAVRSVDPVNGEYSVELTNVYDDANNDILANWMALDPANNTVDKVFGTKTEATKSFGLSNGFTFDAGTNKISYVKDGVTYESNGGIVDDPSGSGKKGIKFTSTSGTTTDEFKTLSEIYGTDDASISGGTLTVDPTNGALKYTYPTVNHKMQFNTSDGAFSYIGAAGEKSQLLNMTVLGNQGQTGNQFKDIDVNFQNCLNYDNGGTSTMGIEKGDISGTRGVGKKLGTMTSCSVDGTGRIYGSYDNGNTVLLGQIAVAQFANASGLEALGNSCYTTTLNSGDFDGIGVDVTADGGSMTTGQLEMSNVDLSAEFTEMITTQRGFQANSRVITTSDTMLEELVNLKR